jgi:tRNA pseudouridine38-40 synthase
MRYFLELAYKGTSYHGWQVQKNAISVQEVLNKALSTLLREEIITTGSGRTDTGVHASQQFVHFDYEGELTPHNLVHKLNSIFPVDIVAYSVFTVKNDAHARFDAVSRSYEYRIIQKRNPFLHQLSYYFPNELHIEKMNLAASKLLLHEDFESFSKVKTDTNTFLCNITRAEWLSENELLTFHISANRFLRGMVRALVGTLLEVGKGKIEVEDFEKIIEKRNRNEAGRAVPAGGLFLTRVEYPDTIYQVS